MVPFCRACWPKLEIHLLGRRCRATSTNEFKYVQFNSHWPVLKMNYLSNVCSICYINMSVREHILIGQHFTLSLAYNWRKRLSLTQDLIHQNCRIKRFSALTNSVVFLKLTYNKHEKYTVILYLNLIYIVIFMTNM